MKTSRMKTSRLEKGLMVMAGVLVVLLVLLLVGVGRPQAQDLPRWQHSLFMPGYTVSKAPDGDWHGAAFTGAGYQTAWTVYDRGELNVIGLGLTHVVNMTSIDDRFEYTIGLNLNFGGNFGVGAGYDVINTYTQKGLAIGQSSWDDNGKLYVSFHLPLNGGGLLNVWK
jgi:hypothetical protein